MGFLMRGVRIAPCIHLRPTSSFTFLSHPVITSTQHSETKQPSPFDKDVNPTILQNLDAKSLVEVFKEMELHEKWEGIRSVYSLWAELGGNLSKNDVVLLNHLLRADVKLGGFYGDVMEVLEDAEALNEIKPNTASFNCVLTAMLEFCISNPQKEYATERARAAIDAEHLLKRMMLQRQKNAEPNMKTYRLLVCILSLTYRAEAALPYIDIILKSGYVLSVEEFEQCTLGCVQEGKHHILVSIIDKCIDQNKAFCPSGKQCICILKEALKVENAELALHSLQFLNKLFAERSAKYFGRFPFIDPSSLVAALRVANRTYHRPLLDASWAGIIELSLYQNKSPSPQAYIEKICATASLGSSTLHRAFSTLCEFEAAYGNGDEEATEEFFSPFAAMHPLVVECSSWGFETLESVYSKLELLSHGEPPCKSVATLNCLLLAYANVGRMDRAFQVFAAIRSSFGLIPNINSYNSLMHGLQQSKILECVTVFEHLVSSGLKPNAQTYAILLQAHVVNKDPSAALSIISSMVNDGFEPSIETMRLVSRRCAREMDYYNMEKLYSLARRQNILARSLDWFSHPLERTTSGSIAANDIKNIKDYKQDAEEPKVVFEKTGSIHETLIKTCDSKPSQAHQRIYGSIDGLGIHARKAEVVDVLKGCITTSDDIRFDCERDLTKLRIVV